MNNYSTYCPEDNKLRLYVGRVPRDEYETLRAQGWTSTPKQDCDFVATWTPEQEDTALEYGGGVLEDEDQSPQDRAADRAERFAGYSDKRNEEAMGTADKYEAGPQVHGYQSQALAERRAARHDRVGTKAVSLWDKAEYWQSRTAGVISHALYKSGPGVRMGRIKELEADIRKSEKDAQEITARNQAVWDIWNGIAGNSELIILKACLYSLHNAEIKPDGEDGKYTTEQARLGMALMMNGDVHTVYGSDRYKMQKENETALISGTLKPEDAGKEWIANHPTRPEDWNGQGRWLNHFRLRLAYENQMLDAQGGRAAFVEMEAGGFIGKHQILKVNKSPATGRVVSVQVKGTKDGYTKESGYTEYKTDIPAILTLNIERLKSDIYRAPTDEERAAFLGAKKAASKDQADNGAKLVNPTKEQAELLQAQMNKAAIETDKGQNYPRKAGEVEEMTQADYSKSCAEYRVIREYRGVKIRLRRCGWQRVESVVIITDKPQKAFPAGVMDVAEAVEGQQELAI